MPGARLVGRAGGWEPEDDGDALLADLHACDEGTDDLLALLPRELVQPARDAFGEVFEPGGDPLQGHALGQLALGDLEVMTCVSQAIFERRDALRELVE